MSRRLVLFFSLLLAALLPAVPAGAMQKRSDQVRTVSGQAIISATVQVYLFGTTIAATIYSDNGITTATNPVTVNALDGSYTYYAPNGRYTEVVTATGYTFTTSTSTDIIFYDHVDGPLHVNSHIQATGLHTWAGTARFPAITSIVSHTTGIFWPAAHHMAISVDPAHEGDKAGVELIRFHAQAMTLHHTAAIRFRHSTAGMHGGQWGHITALRVSRAAGNPPLNNQGFQDGNDQIILGHHAASLVFETQLRHVRAIGLNGVRFHPWDDVINVKEFGATGDGVTDDRAAIVLAVAALPANGGVLNFPPGVFTTTSASALLSITDKNGVTIQGAGVGRTTFRQLGAGPVVELLGTTEIVNARIADVTIDGQSVAGVCIDTNNLKDSVIERFAISGCKNHGIALRGVGNLNNLVRNGRITSPSGITAGARGINAVVGNVNRFGPNIYFNIGGNDADHYQVALDVSGAAHPLSFGNIYDGVVTAIRSSGGFASIHDWFDFTSVGGIAITTAVLLTANNPLTIISPTASPVGGVEALVAFSGGGTRANVTILGTPQGDLGMVSGQPLGQTLTPAALGGTTNNYEPTDANTLSGLYYSTWRISASVSNPFLTGIVAGVDGQQLTLVNVGSNTITLRYNTGSAAANQFFFARAADWVLPPRAALTVVYDSTTQKWRGGATPPRLYETTGSIGGGALGAGACTSGTVAVVGSETFHTVSVSHNTYPGDGTFYFGYVSAAGTVTVKVCVAVALTPTASTYNVAVIQ